MPAATINTYPLSSSASDLVTANLTDADATLAIATASEFIATSGLFTTNRVLTLATTGATTGEIIRITRRDATANTLTVKDDAASTLYTFPASTKRKADFRFDGAHFVLSGHGKLA